jgi:Flp pilus assembly protein TadB
LLDIGFSTDFRITMIASRLLWGSTMDDNSNAELGIAITEAKAAQRKLEHAKGFERSHNGTINQLDERIFGMFAMLVLVILISVWAFTVPPLIRYAVTIAAGLIFVYCKSMATKRKKDLDALRQQQAKEHSRNI